MAGRQRFRPDLLTAALDKAFEAAIRPELWPSVFQDLADAADATGVIALRGDPSQRGAYLCAPRLDASLDHYIANRLFERNPRLAAAARLVHPERITSDRDLPEAAEDLHPAWHHEFLRPFDLGWFAGTFLYEDTQSRLLLSFERSHRREPYQTAETETLERAMARLRGAVALAPALDDAAARGLATGLEEMGRAAIVLDREGQVLLMNERARQRCRGPLAVRGRHLAIATPAANDRLGRFVAALLRARDTPDAPAPEPLAVTDADGTLVLLRGAPLPRAADDLFRNAAAVVTLSFANEVVAHDMRGLRGAFGMTAAESQVASAIAGGADLKTITETSGISVNTARSHLKAVFAKTGTSRQAELAVLINKLHLESRL